MEEAAAGVRRERKDMKWKEVRKVVAGKVKEDGCRWRAVMLIDAPT